MAEQSFGAYITELRERLGISKSELARRTNMSRGYMGFIEADAQPPSMEPPSVGVEKLRALARELGVTEQEMLARGYRPPDGFGLVPDDEFRYPDFRLLHSIIRDIGIDDSEFTEQDMEEILSNVETVIEGYVAKKHRQSQSQKHSLK